MMQKLVAMYDKGEITADHLVVESLHRIDPDNPGLVLEALSNDILQRVLKYACAYRPGKMRTNYGLQPTLDQVTAAKQWIEAKVRQSA